MLDLYTVKAQNWTRQKSLKCGRYKKRAELWPPKTYHSASLGTKKITVEMLIEVLCPFSEFIFFVQVNSSVNANLENDKT